MGFFRRLWVHLFHSAPLPSPEYPWAGLVWAKGRSELRARGELRYIRFFDSEPAAQLMAQQHAARLRHVLGIGALVEPEVYPTIHTLSRVHFIGRPQ